MCWVTLWHPGCVWSLSALECLFPDHAASHRAMVPAEIKQQAASARNLQQIERREQNKPLSHLIPLFSLPFPLSIWARKPFRDYIGNQRDLYRRHWPCQSFWSFALLSDSKVVSHERDWEKYVLSWLLWSLLKLRPCDCFSYIANLCLGIAMSMRLIYFKQQDSYGRKNGHKQLFRYPHIGYFHSGFNQQHEAKRSPFQVFPGNKMTLCH